jgi:hypothetical protein
VRDGFQWHFAPREHRPGAPPGKLVNVWSAPNYAYKEGNLASFLRLRCHARDDGDAAYGDFVLAAPYRAVPDDRRIRDADVRPDSRYFA